MKSFWRRGLLVAVLSLLAANAGAVFASGSNESDGALAPVSDLVVDLAVATNRDAALHTALGSHFLRVGTRATSSR